MAAEHDKVPPPTLTEQVQLQSAIDELYSPYKDGGLERLKLYRREHIRYLQRGLERLSNNYIGLDASRPWLCYWILHSLDLLGVPLTEELRERAIFTINECQHPQGGFGGGPNQLAHLACTFAAVSALAIIGTKAAYETINRTALLNFLLRMKQPDGSFTVHEDGEIDVRGSYCALACASLCSLLAKELEENSATFISNCQTFEGGFGAVPYSEAHAGYTYCGLAALAILDQVDSIKIDLHALDRFAVLAQCSQAGGFRGRTHKLVDGCYSFWGGALFPLLRRYCPASYFNSIMVQKYILVCCQNETTGGLRDKPGKSEDYYHTCYCLSGLTIAQRETIELPDEEGGENEGGIVLGDAGNLLHPVLPEYNLLPQRVDSIKQYFSVNKL